MCKRSSYCRIALALMAILLLIITINAKRQPSSGSNAVTSGAQTTGQWQLIETRRDIVADTSYSAAEWKGGNNNSVAAYKKWRPLNADTDSIISSAFEWQGIPGSFKPDEPLSVRVRLTQMVNTRTGYDSWIKIYYGEVGGTEQDGPDVLLSWREGGQSRTAESIIKVGIGNDNPLRIRVHCSVGHDTYDILYFYKYSKGTSIKPVDNTNYPSGGSESSRSMVLDTVTAGSLASWNKVYNPTNFNPRFYFEEVRLDNGAIAIRTRVSGNTLATCETKWLRRIYDTGKLNSSEIILELTADFTFNGTTYNLPSIAVELLDDNGRSLASQRFFGKGIIGNFNYSRLAETGYIELPAATGVHRIPLSRIGPGITFSKIAIYLMNYTCEGENAIVFRRLALHRRTPR